MSAEAAGPSLGISVETERLDEAGIVTSTRVEPDLALLAGHYPGFPIFPGVCLVDCAHQSVLVAARRLGQDVALEAIETTRFLGPVFPGDRVTTDVRLHPSTGGWLASGALRSARGKVADVRLRYRLEEGS